MPLNETPCESAASTAEMNAASIAVDCRGRRSKRTAARDVMSFDHAIVGIAGEADGRSAVASYRVVGSETACSFATPNGSALFGRDAERTCDS